MKTVLSLSNIPNQKVSYNLTIGEDKKIVDVYLRTLSNGELIVSIFIEDVSFCLSRRAVNKIPLVLNKNILGNFYFEDTLEKQDPNYKELDGRFKFIYDNEYVLN